MTELHSLQVGQPYLQGRTSWPECSQFNVRAGHVELVLFLARPSADETLAARTGEAEFALVVEGDLLVWLYRFGRGKTGIPWSDAPYSWHLVPTDQQQLPPPFETPQSRWLLQVHLVDASNGLLRGLRAVTLSPALSRELRAAVQAQAARPWPGQEAYDRQLAHLYQRYPTTEALLAAATIRERGGQ